MMPRMVVALEPHNIYTRGGCCACGGSTDKTGVDIHLLDANDPRAGGMTLCEECLEAGPAGMAQRMRQDAEQIRQRLQWLERSASEVEQLDASGWPDPELARLAVCHIHEALGWFSEPGPEDLYPGADLALEDGPNGARAYSPEALEALRPALEQAQAEASRVQYRLLRVAPRPEAPLDW